MTPERWTRVKDVFGAALEREGDAREAYVREVCGADSPLRDEVASLLRAHDAAGAFMEDGAVPVVRPPFTPGQVLAERYRVTRFIAQGGIGEVYEADDLELGGRVALKTLRPEFTRHGPSVDRLKREVQLARLVTHANACRIFGWVVHRPAEAEEAVPIVTMELLDGETLAERLATEGRLPPEDVLTIAMQMATGLMAVHEADLVHRDFKASNVMLVRPASPGDRERAVIMDFGLARGAAVGEQGEHALMGTLESMAPEQLQGGDVNAATDVYAFGLVLFEMLTGTPAFVAETPVRAAARRLEEPPPSPRDLVPSLDPRWATVVLRCLAPRPADRPRDAAELLRALRKLQLLPRPLDTVAVAGFRNQDGGECDGLSAALAELLRVEFRRGERLAVVGAEAVSRWRARTSVDDRDLEGAATVQALRAATGAELVAVGWYRVLEAGAHSLRVSARVLDGRTGATLADADEETTRVDVPGAIERLASSLLVALPRR